MIHTSRCVMQSGRGAYTDIAGVTLEAFMKKTGVKVKVLRRVDTAFANQRLDRNGSLAQDQYVEYYLRN